MEKDKDEINDICHKIILDKNMYHRMLYVPFYYKYMYRQFTLKDLKQALPIAYNPKNVQTFFLTA